MQTQEGLGNGRRERRQGEKEERRIRGRTVRGREEGVDGVNMSKRTWRGKKIRGKDRRKCSRETNEGGRRGEALCPSRAPR